MRRVLWDEVPANSTLSSGPIPATLMWYYRLRNSKNKFFDAQCILTGLTTYLNAHLSNTRVVFSRKGALTGNQHGQREVRRTIDIYFSKHLKKFVGTSLALAISLF